jgi:hypothetical protein
VQERLEWCFETSKRKDFAKLVIEEIRRKGSAFVVRIHCSGEFYSSAYVQKWTEIIRCSPHTRFFAYTRAWRVPSIEPSLRELAGLDNMRLLYSADRETGEPPCLPDGVRVAWMMVDEDESIPDVDLIFRDYPLRRERRPRIGLSLVCPYDQPRDREFRPNCGTCGFCWR